MKYLKFLIFKSSFFFNNFLYLKKNKNLFFFKYKKLLILYLKFFFLRKIKNTLYFLFFLKKNKKIIDLSFFIIQKLKLNLNLLLVKSNVIFLLHGRGFKLLSLNHSKLVLKLGFNHNINLKIKGLISIQVLTKNNQKFRLTGNLLFIIQILACLNFLKKKNIYNLKGIFFNTEKIKLKKSTKSS